MRVSARTVVAARLRTRDPAPSPRAWRPVRRGWRGGRGAEVAVAALGSLALAVLMTWPALRDPASTVPQDLGDPLYFVWQLAWVGHALTGDPSAVWTTNAFSGAPGSLAYTDTMLGYAPASALAHGMRGALVVYNVLFVLVAALAFLGAHLLARVVGACRYGALVAAAAFAYAPWRLAHERHLNVLSTGGIALALALLAYGHGWHLRRTAAAPPGGPVTGPPAGPPGGPAPGSRRPARPGWALAGWLVACWQLTLGFAVGLPFAWALVTVLAVATGTGLLRALPASRALRACRARRDGGAPAVRHSRRLLAADALGLSAFAVTGVLLAIPYRRVVADFPGARRTEEMLHLYSPPLHGLVTAPAESVPWGGLQAGWRSGMDAVGEQALLPGFAVLALALAGLGYSAWTVRHRVLLGAGTLAGAVLCLGTSAPGGGAFTYLPLFHHVPGWEALRTPGRLVLWVTLCLGLLAAGAVTRLAEDVARRRAGRAPALAPSRWGGRPAAGGVAALLLLPAAAVTAEGAGRMTYPRVPPPPAALAALPQPLLVLPTSQGGDFLVKTWSTDGWPLLANGGSGFEPPSQARLRRDLAGFPDARSVAALRALGVRTVVLSPERARGTPWDGAADRPATGLPLTVRRGAGPDRGAVVYTLAAPAP
jgi:hypothetical protein